MASPNSAVVVGGGSSKPRGRNKGAKSSQKKQPQRGMGVAQLEKHLRQQEQQLQQRNHLFHLNNHFHPSLDQTNTLLHAFPHFTPRPPHIHMPPDPCEERRLCLSAGPAIKPELPSIPNVDHFHLNTLNFKKKRINNGVDDLDACLIPGGRDTKYYQKGVQVLAIHPKDRNVVMEYGFFPVTPSTSTSSLAVSSSSSTSFSAYAAAAASAPTASIDLSLRL